MKALVLSGGKGTRLRPLTNTLPKQLIPVANRPILYYVLDHLRDAGIKETGIIVSPENSPQIHHSVSQYESDLRFTYIRQEQPLGLAHAVKVAQPFLGNDPFVMYLGDNLIGQGIQDFVEAFETARADAVVLLKEVENPRMFGVAEVDSEGRIRRLVEKPKEPRSKLALVGVYVLGPSIHQAIAEIKPSWRGELEITDAIQRLLEKGRTVQSFQLKSWWRDTGKKDDLLKANRVVLEEWASRDIRGMVDAESRVVDRVIVEEGACIKRSEVRGPAVIGAGTVVEEAFVGPYTSVGRDCTIKNSALEHCVVLDGVRLKDVRQMKDSILGRNAVVRSFNGNPQRIGLVIGDDAEVLL